MGARDFFAKPEPGAACDRKSEAEVQPGTERWARNRTVRQCRDAQGTGRSYINDVLRMILGVPQGIQGRTRSQGEKGNVLFASFELSRDDGSVHMIVPDEYDSPAFSLDYDSKSMEVIIHG